MNFTKVLYICENNKLFKIVMAFPKGHNLSGSRKGCPNKASAEVKPLIIATITGNYEDLQPALNRLKEQNPAMFVKYMIDLMKLVVPTEQNLSVTDKTPVFQVATESVKEKLTALYNDNKGI